MSNQAPNNWQVSVTALLSRLREREWNDHPDGLPIPQNAKLKEEEMYPIDPSFAGTEYWGSAY